jgi:NADPH:quinone reductase-like Zn-dependent oxidoreductase
MQPCRGRAAISDGKGGLEVGEITVSAPAGGEVRVRLLAAGLCRTDRASLSWGVPLVIGHEGAGVVDDVGADIEDLKAGDAGRKISRAVRRGVGPFGDTAGAGLVSHICSNYSQICISPFDHCLGALLSLST